MNIAKSALHSFYYLFGLSLATLLVGCKQESEPAMLAPTPDHPDTVVRFHWQGKKQLGAEAGAYLFMRIWDLPDSKKLETQTLDRLSAFLTGIRFQSFSTQTPPALDPQFVNAFARRLLDDVVREQVYFESRRDTNQSYQWTFAIKLNEWSSGFWRTNLTVVFAALTGAQTVDVTENGRGWIIQSEDQRSRIQLSRVGEWTVVGAARDKNVLLEEITARIRRDRVPFVPASPTNWIETRLNFQHLTGVLPRVWRENAPELLLNVSGDGGNVLAHALVNFPKPVSARIDEWNIPLHLIHQPAASFTAVRGIQPWLKSFLKTPTGELPNQAFLWSYSDQPFQTYLAAPWDAVRVSDLADHLITAGNPWLAENGYIGFERHSQGLTWGNLPTLKPFLSSSERNTSSWLYAGLLPKENGQNRFVTGSEVQGLNQPGLVYYDWETTGQLLQPRLILTQTARQILRRPELPLDTASLNWLVVLIPRLGPSETTARLVTEHKLSISRKSTIGFTALELHLLADWLESPRFPRGLYSTSASTQP